MGSTTLRAIQTLLGSLIVVASLASARGSFAACEPAGGLQLISRAADGQPTNDRNVLPAISGDGCSIAFKSYGSNLVDNDTNGKVDVFVFDGNTGATERVPLRPATGSSGNPNDNSFPPALNGDGSIVAFASLSNNLTSGDFNQESDVFVYERAAQTTSILTLRDDGELGGGAPDLPPSVSADGRLVAFSASSPKIVNNDFNEANDVFVYDRDSGATELISVATTGSDAGKAAKQASNGGIISADGCVVAFYSDAPNVVAADRNDVRDVFVRNRCNGTSERVSVTSDGREGNGASQAAGFQPGISGDGQLVVFSSEASNLVEGDDNSATDVFLRDRNLGTTTRLSKAANGDSANGSSQYPAISGDGRFVAFQSDASNLVDGDSNGVSDIFIVELASGAIQRIVSTEEPNGNSIAPQLNADGTIVVFQSDATNLVDGDTNGVGDIFAATNELSFTPTPTATVQMIPTPTVSATPTGDDTLNTPTVTPTGSEASGTATATRTATRPLHEPTLTPTRTSIGGGSPTPTRTVTSNGSQGSGGGGGGGCSCDIDPKSGRGGDPTPWSAALLPMAMWILRQRESRRARGN